MIVNGWLKRSRKSASNLTFAKWKGLTIARQKSPGPPPETVPQKVLDVRAQLRPMKDIYNYNQEIIAAGYNEWTNQMGVWSAFNKFNWIPASDYSTPGAPVTVYANVVLGQGAILITDYTAVADASDENVTITWSATPGGNQDASDIPWLAVYNNTTSAWIYSSTTADVGTVDRADGTKIVSMAPGTITTGDELYVFILFQGATGGPNEGKASNSIRKTITVTA